MKSFTCYFLFLALIYAAFASPSPIENHSFFQNTGNLVQELINNLKKAADQAKDAVSQFNSGLQEQAKQCRERFMQGLKQLQDRVSESIKKLQEKFTGSSSAIGECIAAHRDDAQTIYHDASEQMSACTDLRLQEGEDLIKKLNALCANGQEIATQAFTEMRNCTELHSGNFLAVGTCIGSVALKTEAKGASFLMQSGLAIGRLNLFMSTLPASLEVCAGSSLVNAGMGTARILMDIGSCSTTSVLNSFGSSSASLSIDTSSGTNMATTAAGSVSSGAESASASISSGTSSAVNAIQSALPFPK